jgi:hypothetical protein
MCIEFLEKPYALPLEFEYTRRNTRVLKYSLLLGKVTEKRGGVHVSTRGFEFPIGRMVHDANARIGDHGRALHYASSPKSAHRLKGAYGSHRLAVLPPPHVWKAIEKAGMTNRCWHSSGGRALFCLDCSGIKFDVLKNPDFWKDLRLNPGETPNSLGVPLREVWHRTIEQPIEQ